MVSSFFFFFFNPVLLQSLCAGGGFASPLLPERTGGAMSPDRHSS